MTQLIGQLRLSHFCVLNLLNDSNAKLTDLEGVQVLVVSDAALSMGVGIRTLN